MSGVRGKDRERDRDYGNRPHDSKTGDNNRDQRRTSKGDEKEGKTENNELKKLAFGERSAYIEQKRKEKELADTKPLSLADIDSDDDAMLSALGLPSSFGSTKGQHVKGANSSHARVKTTREYRQYMNRKGGFHQNLDKIQ